LPLPRAVPSEFACVSPQMKGFWRLGLVPNLWPPNR